MIGMVCIVATEVYSVRTETCYVSSRLNLCQYALLSMISVATEACTHNTPVPTELTSVRTMLSVATEKALLSMISVRTDSIICHSQ